MTGRYQISEKIGDGEVFLAHDPSLERQVALRFVTENVAREAKSAAALDHPYICKIYEIGEENGKPFIVLEYVRGETLERRLACGPLPHAGVVRIASEIAEALETAHGQGVVHGDLKPSNIMLTEGGHVKLMNFGLATTRDDDPRSDIVSFGTVLNEMVAASTPELERIIKKMLAGEGYQRVHEVRAELVRLQRRPAATKGRKRWLIAVAAFPLLALAVWRVDTLIPREQPSIAVLPMRNISDDPLESDYIGEGISQAVIARLVQTGLRVTPWETAVRYGQSGEPPEAIARELNTDTVLVGTFHLADDRILTNLSLVEAGSGFASWAEQFEAPYEDIFQMQQQIAVRAATSLKRTLTGEEEAALATPESQSIDAYDFYLQAAHLLQEGTREATDVAFEYCSQAVELDPDLAEAHVGLGVVHHERYYFGWGGSLESLDRAEASFERALRLNPGLQRARTGLILIHYQRGHTEACLMQGRDVARLGQPDTVATLLTRAAAYQQGGLMGRAVPLLRDVLKLDPVNQEAQWRLVTNTWGVDSEVAVEAATAYVQRFGDDPEVHQFVAMAHHLLGNRERAREHYEKALGLPARAESAADAAPYAVVFGGLLYEQLGDVDRATQIWQLGVQVFRDKLEETPDNRKLSLLLASSYGLLGDRASMMAMEERALAQPDANSWEVLQLAAVHAKQGETDHAAELLRRSLQQGLVDRNWQFYFQLANVPVPESDAFVRFVKAFEAETRRFHETY